MRTVEALPLRLLLLILVAFAIAGPVVHHHDSTGPESHCAVCHFVAGLVLLAGGAVTLWLLPPLLAWSLPDRPCFKLVSLCLAPCGLRAPPLS